MSQTTRMAIEIQNKMEEIVQIQEDIFVLSNLRDKKIRELQFMRS